MARKKTVSASTARKTIKAQAHKAAPLVEVTKKSAGDTRTKAAPAARAAAAATIAAATAPQQPKAMPAPRPATVRATPAPRQTKPAAPEGNGLEALMTAGQDNLAACMTCGTIVSKGLETLGKEVMTLAQASIDANLAATKSLMAAKTPQDLVDLQTSFARDRLEGLANETAKIGALTMNVASQALEPLRSRFDANSRTVFRPFGL